MGLELLVRVGRRPIQSGRVVCLDDGYLARCEASGRTSFRDHGAAYPQRRDRRRMERKGGMNAACVNARADAFVRSDRDHVAPDDDERNAVDPCDCGDLDQPDMRMLRISEKSPRLTDDAAAKELGTSPQSWND